MECLGEQDPARGKATQREETKADEAMRKCGVKFSGDLDRRPLCQPEFEGDAPPSALPRNEARKLFSA